MPLKKLDVKYEAVERRPLGGSFAAPTHGPSRRQLEVHSTKLPAQNLETVRFCFGLDCTLLLVEHAL